MTTSSGGCVARRAGWALLVLASTLMPVGGFGNLGGHRRRRALQMSAAPGEAADGGGAAKATVKFTSDNMVKSLGDADSLELLLARRRAAGDDALSCAVHTQTEGTVTAAAPASVEASLRPVADYSASTSSIVVAPPPVNTVALQPQNKGLMDSKWFIPGAIVASWAAVSWVTGFFVEDEATNATDAKNWTQSLRDNPFDFREGDGGPFGFGKRVRRPETIRLLYQIKCLDCRATSYPARGREELFDFDQGLKCVICKSKNIVDLNNPEDPRNVRPDGTNMALERRTQMRKYMTTDRREAQRALSDLFALDARKRKEYGREAVLGDEEFELLGIDKEKLEVIKEEGDSEGGDQAAGGGGDSGGDEGEADTQDDLLGEEAAEGGGSQDKDKEKDEPEEEKTTSEEAAAPEAEPAPEESEKPKTPKNY